MVRIKAELCDDDHPWAISDQLAPGRFTMRFAG
jgi:hypothetical protein